MVDAAHAETAVLTIDQFEETFTLCQDESERDAFFNNLLHLAQSDGAPHRLILTMRTDYEIRLDAIPPLQALFKRGETRVTSMNAAELRDAIEKPALPIGLKFDDELIDAIIREILGEPAALPLLQFALLKLWDNREKIASPGKCTGALAASWPPWKTPLKKCTRASSRKNRSPAAASCCAWYSPARG
ncbi:MAG: hypothetical protein M5U34_31105 [Chloroflexi bacterium]|nr:hypothetical protein [Chloroflexota bacterium]